jgi:hypothetical protein
MTRVTWDDPGQRFYENGVSQGVFYTPSGLGVPWNGLISVEQKNNDSLEPLYYDGLKYADLVVLGNFEGSIKAFTYPDEFLECEGVSQSETGFYLTAQPKKRFGMSYKTAVHNDEGPNTGYKLHLLWNILAIPSDKVYETLSLDSEPTEFEWDISAIPEEVSRFRPTAHVVIDSRKIDPFLLVDIENILYGTATEPPQLPNLGGLMSFVQKWGRLVITDNGDGTWTATSPLDGVISMLDAETFSITSDTAVYLDLVEYEISSDDVNLEDL